MKWEYISSLQTVAALGLLWFFWYYVWIDYAIDRFRQDLFAIRDKLFILAAEQQHGLNFESKVYGRLRLSINSMIRFSHHVNLLHAVIFQGVSALPFKENPTKLKSPVDVSIDLVQDEKLRAELQRIRLQIGLAIFRLLGKISPTFVVCIVVAVLCVVVQHVISRAAKATTSFVEEVAAQQMETIRAIESQAILLDAANNELALAA